MKSKSYRNRKWAETGWMPQRGEIHFITFRASVVAMSILAGGGLPVGQVNHPQEGRRASIRSKNPPKDSSRKPEAMSTTQQPLRNDGGAGPTEA